MSDINSELLSFIKASPSVYHAASVCGRILEEAGFSFLPEYRTWKLTPGKYYTIRGGSSLIAFVIPEYMDFHFQICASHCDSPTFKLKDHAVLSGPDGYLRVNAEPYGGMIDYTWFDRPLSVAGRVMLESGSGIESRLVYIDRDILMIPSMPIHFNKDVNKGAAFNRQTDMCPVASCGELGEHALADLISAELHTDPDAIVSMDLYLVNRQNGTVWGIADEFISSPKLDDLQAVFTSLKGFTESACETVDSSYTAPCAAPATVFCCFDNEEVGSGTMQGARSTFLKDVLTRIGAALGKTSEELHAAISSSFMVSFDNAHALHPAHPEKYDSANRCFMNGGIVIKENAAQKYTTNAFSRAVFKKICDMAEVPCQTFANRSDTAGGSTLGNISTSQVSIHSVDIGLAQLAMHSAYETAGARDSEYAVRALRTFYNTNIKIEGESCSFELPG